MARYDHQQIEKKWQKRWAEAQAFRADDASPKEKRYILDMYPYPSGAGLHVGHVEGYTATDIYSRYLRVKGYEVLHPMGWDAFGLPAENYAVKTKVPPAGTTEAAISTFIEQINSLGLSYDWSREIGSHRPDYYKWTQWLFGLLYKRGLAYKQKAKVNWCPKDQTVLANEQVVDGKCERCGSEVIQKDLEQWFFRITKYAEALLSDLEGIDWPDSTKAAQKNWIGKSEGAEIDFPVAGTDEKLRVFTTRPDTLYGATYMVLAPEHPLIDALRPRITNFGAVEAYREETAKKTELERTALAKDKTGVKLEGVAAINPATKEKIPVYLADYVLSQYGTGAIMAVPAHDERDHDFARKFGIPLRRVIQPGQVSVDMVVPFGTEVDVTTELDKKLARIESGDEVYAGTGTLINSGEFTGMPSEDAKRKITEAVGGQMKTTYRLRDWLISRQRYWGAPIPVVYDPEGKPHLIPEEHLPWLLPTDVEFMPTGESPIAKSKELVERTEAIFGKGWRPEVDTMDTFVCSSWYFFRFADPHNDQAFADQEKLARWLPVDLYMGGAEHTVLHLLYARFFTKVLHELGLIGFTEPFLKLRHQGTILAEDGRKMSKSLGNVINPTEVVEEYGADSLRLYEMFMGPLEVAKPWNTKNILGVRRFLERVYALAPRVADGELDPETDVLLNQAIEKVTADIESMSFNTVISQLMILSNRFAELDGIPRSAYETLLILLNPLAPHICHELWELLGNEGRIDERPWPVADAAKLKAASVTVGVQVNGKVRGTITIAPGAPAEEVLRQARADEGVAKWLSGKREVKAVYVPGRIVSLVVEG